MRDDTFPNDDTLPTAATEELSERRERASVSPPPYLPSNGGGGDFPH